MSRLRWFFGHTLRQAYYAVRYRRERREMAERVLWGYAVRTVREPDRGPVTTETVQRLRASGFDELAEIAEKYVKKPRRWVPSGFGRSPS